MIKIYPKSRMETLNNSDKIMNVSILEYSREGRFYKLLTEQRMSQKNMLHIRVIGDIIDYNAKSETGKEVYFVSTIEDKHKGEIVNMLESRGLEGIIKFW